MKTTYVLWAVHSTCECDSFRRHIERSSERRKKRRVEEGRGGKDKFVAS
jgi:hypothetical protein